MQDCWCVFTFIWGIFLAVSQCTDTSTILSDFQGAITAAITSKPRVASMSWQISPLKCSTVHLVFETLQIGSAELHIYSMSDLISPPIFSCVDPSSCLNIPPAPFQSLTASVLVELTFITNALNFRPTSFILHYVSGFASPIDASGLLSNFSLPLTMPYAKIYPVLAGGQFPPKTSMQWLLNVNQYYENDIPTSKRVDRVVFSIAELLLPDNGEMTVEIYDGPDTSSRQLFHSSYTSDYTDKWIYTSSFQATVIMSSSSDIFHPVSIELTYTSDGAMQACGSIASPEVVDAETMLIVDGSGTTNKMRSGQMCSWLIQSYQTGEILLWMQLVSIHPEASVTIYDGVTSAAKLLWNCGGCQFTVPPPLRSTTGVMAVYFSSSSRSSTTYKGFVGAYATQHSQSHGIGSRVVNLYMSAAFAVQPPGDGLTYSADVDYHWIIQPSTKSNIYLSIYLLNFTSCTDYLAVFNGATMGGELIAKFSCGATNPKWLISNGRVMHVALHSGPGKKVSNGFQFSFYSDGANYQCGLSSSPAQIADPSMILTDGSSSAERMYPSQSCQWNIFPGVNFQGLTMYFTRFDLQGATLRLEFGGQVVILQDLSVIPAPLVLTSAQLLVVFTSTPTVTGKGFQAEYFTVSADLAGPGDSQVELYASSMIDLQLPTNQNGQYRSNWSISWLILPVIASTQRIYLSFSYFNIDDCNDTLMVYDGDSTLSSVLAIFCGNQLPSAWVESSGSALLLQFMSNENEVNTGKFSLSYYSDGPNYHCGFLLNPGVFLAPSMVITDGSTSDAIMDANQYCIFRIQPANATNVVLHFERLDIRGGSIEVYDDYATNSSLVYACHDCNAVPASMLSQGPSMSIIFRSSSTPAGTGFRIFYASLATTSSIRSSVRALVGPQNMSFTQIPDNSTAWYFKATQAISSLSYSPGLYRLNADDVPANVVIYDGRPLDLLPTARPHFRDVNKFCGVLFVKHGPLDAVLRSQGSILHATNSPTMFPFQRNELPVTAIGALQRSSFSSDSLESDAIDRMLLSSDAECRYMLESGTDQAIRINVTGWGSKNTNIQIYGGLNGYDRLLYQNGNFTASLEGGIAPCGKALIIITTTSNPNSFTRMEGLNISFEIDHDDMPLHMCDDYRKSLQPVKHHNSPFWSQLRLLMVGAAVFLSVALAIACSWRRLVKLWFRLCRMRRKYLTDHPRYTPVIDGIRNHTLSCAQCVICRLTLKALSLECSHTICIDDLKMYLETALGDTSLFPVKCPMHFEGCKGLIGPDVAKRFLSRRKYAKFLEFHDRAIYGDGMRCIFCHQFVNFPAVMYVTMVECPYCDQKFCMRCKKPWHVDSLKCPLDADEVALESWRLKRGAQKCPGCQKIIEKEDPSTCNHMVHKNTDSIPCLRDRTDFCYLCGTEVLPDYPHDEINNLGVNHFPEGVFQNCRVVIEKERDRFRRRRRYRRNQIGAAQIVPIESLPHVVEEEPAIITARPTYDVEWLQPIEHSPISHQRRRALV